MNPQVCQNKKCLSDYFEEYKDKVLKRAERDVKRLASVRKRKIKKATTSRSKLRSNAMKNADKWFSRYIRIKYAFVIDNGIVYDKCFITGLIKRAEFMDNGHCFSRDFQPIRYDEDNCRPQNRSSNRYQGEKDHYKFRENLEREIGTERFERLDRLKNEQIDANLEHYEEIATKYRKKVNKLIREKNIIKWW